MSRLSLAWGALAALLLASPVGAEPATAGQGGASAASILARIELPQAGAGIHNLRALRDGDLLAIGAAPGPGGDRDMAVWKLGPDLSLVRNFGQGGLARFGGSKDDQAADAIERLDGQGRPIGLLVAGQVRSSDGDMTGRGFRGGADLALLGLTPRGEVDPAYGTGGVQVMGGAGDDELIVHLNNFSEPGLRFARQGQRLYLAAMTTSTDGDFPTAGMVGRPMGRDALVMRLDAAGRLDLGFGANGVLRLGTEPQPNPKLRGPNDFLFSLAVTDQGVFAGGYTLGVALRQGDHVSPARGNGVVPPDAACQGPGREKFCYRMDGMLARLRPDGSLDPAWGDGGVRFVGGSGQEKLYGIDVDGQGRLLFLGRTSSHDLDLRQASGAATGFDTFIGRLTPAGDLDPAFGAGGMAIFGAEENLKGARILACGDGRLAAMLHGEKNEDEDETADNAKEAIALLFLDQRGQMVQRLTLDGVGKATGLAATRDGALAVAGRSTAGDGGEHAVIALVRPPSGWRCPLLP